MTESNDGDLAPMTVDDALADLALVQDDLPIAGLVWSLANRDAARPRLLRVLEEWRADAAPSTEADNLLFFAIHLLGEMAETAAYRPLCRLLMDAKASDRILGDAITEHLNGILINVYDGDPAPLRGIVEAPRAEPYVRGACLEALTYLTVMGRLDEEETRAYLLHLHDSIGARDKRFLWATWAMMVAHLGHRTLAGRAERVLERDDEAVAALDVEEFREMLREGEATADRMANLERDGIRPYGDTVALFSSWHYSGDGAPDDALDEADALLWEQALLAASGEPAVNLYRHVGRNDPCPCGSGRKHKHGCLRAA